MISYFSEFKKVDDHSNKIKEFDSKTKKTRANKLSTDELTKKQTEEHEIETTFFSAFDSSFLNEKNDADDD
jgi:hypothetical protein